MDVTPFLALAPDAFLITGKAWIEATAGVLNAAIAQFGIIALAALGVYANVRKSLASEVQQTLREVKERQDRQGARIDQVAIATQAPVKEANITAETVNVEPTPSAAGT